MNIKKIIFVSLLLFIAGNGCAMRPVVTVNVGNNYPAAPMPYYPSYPITYVPTYYYPSTYDYSYWPTWSYYDDYYWYPSYNDGAVSSFVKTCAITGVLALAFALIGAIASH